MELCYYKSENGNFGDDLNPYILDHLGKSSQSESDDFILLFIGTILHNNFAEFNNIDDFKKRKKIVMGSGIRYLNNPVIIDETWDIRFLRGPLSSLSLLNNCNSFITDPAYLIRETPIFQTLPTVKKYKMSIMPHFLSLDKIDWVEICKKFNINFISPAGRDIETILSEISQSEVLITEAMHGAIIADALRVPWKRFKYASNLYETDLVSEFKWSDWLFSMGLRNEAHNLNYSKVLKRLDPRFNLPMLKPLRGYYLDDSFEHLIKSESYQLSNDKLLIEKTERLATIVNSIL